MASHVVVGALIARNEEARQKILDQLVSISEYARTKEPGVVKYAVTLPRDPTDETSIYVFEEYADQAALDSHMASEPVQNILKLFQAEPQLLGGAGEVLNLEPKSGFTRPEVKGHPSPYIGFATLDYKEGTVTSALNGWNGIADYAQKHESGALSYNVMKNKGNENQLRLLEVYESENYHWDTHAKSGVVARNRESQANNKTAMKHVWLKIVGGYLTKESPLPNL